ncbi:hypothetical protein V5N11_020315 [Cardamine amara subsp. amara]|uniref:KIB1-4 beta-propeller domain-containing protein n=1 Tax=Cardamine amara subsp. amara TaxID=228776 RepID=A0ABD1C2V5_CARAN
MSSLLVSLSSKPFLRKLALRCHTLRHLSSSTTTNPYMMYCVTYCGDNVSYDGKEYPVAGAMTKLRMYDPAKEDYFTVGDKPLPKEMVRSSLVGSSHGWGVFFGPHNSTLISDYWNPSSSKSNPKMIHLPPRPDHLNKTGLVSSVAMSSSPEEDDCVTAVKFKGRQVNIYKPGLEDMVILTPKLFEYFDKGKLMYSKRDQRFYILSSGGRHLCSFSAAESTTPQYHDLRFHNFPQFSVSESLDFVIGAKKEYFVESPSGQRFLVKWYVEDPATKYVEDPVLKRLKPKFRGTGRFMVFREEEDMNMCYTEDIGDLCIFLGNNEPFCVKASSSPGLNPNFIYFAGEGYNECFGDYDIATRTPRNFIPKSISAFSDLTTNGQGQVYMVCDWVPHWVPPVSL